MKVVDIRKKTESDLTKELALKRKELESYTQNLAKGKEKNTAGLKTLKRDYARMLTILNQQSYAKEEK